MTLPRAANATGTWQIVATLISTLVLAVERVTIRRADTRWHRVGHCRLPGGAPSKAGRRSAQEHPDA
jgi:hypothetical protein